MTNVDEIRFWQAVEMARQKTGVDTLQQLAAKMGVGTTYFAQLKVRGNDPKVAEIRWICLNANVSSDWILGLTNIRERRWRW